MSTKRPRGGSSNKPLIIESDMTDDAADNAMVTEVQYNVRVLEDLSHNRYYHYAEFVLFLIVIALQLAILLK
ncbi:MAG: hypothetical protein JSS82_00040 [Bacteroidetes bacterium]|nr:hypothetical protein [Bacteroidota bacterium]